MKKELLKNVYKKVASFVFRRKVNFRSSEVMTALDSNLQIQPEDDNRQPQTLLTCYFRKADETQTRVRRRRKR